MKKIKTGVWTSLAAVAGAVLARIYYEGHHFVVEQYELQTEKLSQSEKGFRFVLLSDLHNYDFGNNNADLIRAIEALEPQAVMVAGDMVDTREGADVKTAVAFMNALCERWQVYFADGNHEQRLELYKEQYGDMEKCWQQGIDHENLHMLKNKFETLQGKNGEKLRIYGLEMDRRYYQRFRGKRMTKVYLNRVLGKCDPSYVNILIAHNPRYFQTYAEWGADVVLSGHIHGGMVILPVLGGMVSPQVEFFPKYYAGVYRQGESQMLLSRGLHMHSIPVRLGNMPEVSCVVLKGTSQAVERRLADKE